MPLLAFWASSRRAVEELSIEQVVASAGDGAIKDGSLCSQELREYLAQIPSGRIAAYIDHCLSSSFVRSGMVLQDLVNELGRRLDYRVTNGRYHGTSSAVGFDGAWLSPEGHTIVVEVKTTDAYRVSLDTIVGYRNKLVASGEITGPSSVLIVVGREETGELEEQVRGSRHAWDIRLISADSLIKLVQLKENAEGLDTGRKIRSLLTPMEYTRLDDVIDVVFTTAKDVENAGAAEVAGEDGDQDAGGSEERTRGTWQFTESHVLDGKRERILTRFSTHIGTAFVKNSRATYWDSSHEHRLACTISKRYTRRSAYPYWYAYHPQWDEFLQQGSDSYVIFGCMDLPFAFAIPWKIFHDHLDALNTTTTKDEHTYWHVHLAEATGGQFAMLLPRMSSSLILAPYRLALES